MEFLKRSTFALAAMAAISAVPRTAHADLLGLNTMIGGPSITTFFGGAFVAANSGPVATGSFHGTAITAVFRGPASIICPAGNCLDFYYQVQTVNTFPNSDGPNRESFFDFTGFVTDVYQIANGSAIGGGWVNGTVASTTTDRSLTGATIGANYTNSIFSPGLSSLTFVIRTNATAFTAGNFGVIDGGASQIAAFSPTAVPEPSTVALLATGLIGMVGYTRRRRNNAA
jgi:hypothetical protein